MLTTEEATFLVDAFNGVKASPGTIPGNIHGAIPYTSSHGCDPVKLAQKVERWSQLQRTELLRKIEAFWANGTVSDIEARLREVGLI
jgi:hypothetical protein